MQWLCAWDSVVLSFFFFWGGHTILLFQTELKCCVAVPGPLLPPFSAVRREIFPFLSPYSDNAYSTYCDAWTPGVGASIFPLAGYMTLVPFLLSDYAILLYYARPYFHRDSMSAIDSQSFTSHHSAFKLFLFINILLQEAGHHSSTR